MERKIRRRFAHKIESDKSKRAIADLAYCKAYRDGNQTACNIMAQRHYPFVLKVAPRFIGQGLDLDDLIQVGLQGIPEAVKRYDGRVKFGTYLVWWVTAKIRDEIRRTGRAIRAPHNAMDTVAKIKKIPVEERTEKEMGELRAWDVTEMLPNDSDSGMSTFEALPDQGESPDESVQAEEMRIRIAHHLAGLDQKSRRVIELRFGLGGGEGLTLNSVAEMMGVSRERVRQIEAQALAKMRKLAQNSREKLFCES
jgi:RNA polymerase primary sigma factor